MAGIVGTAQFDDASTITGCVRIYSMTLISNGSGNGSVNLRTGLVVGGAIWVKETGVISTGKTFEYGKLGILFPNGVYIQYGTNASSVILDYVVEE